MDEVTRDGGSSEKERPTPRRAGFRPDPEQMIEESTYALALGNLVLTLASLELFVVNLIWALVDPADNRVGKAVTGDMNLSRMATFIRRCASTVDEDLGASLTEIALNLRELNADRNQMIHSHWTWAQTDTDGQPVRGRLTFRKISDPTQTRVEPTAVPVSEIEEVEESARALMLKIVRVTGSLRPIWAGRP